MTKDPYNLKRFLIAQETVYERALAELRDGQKRSHWMWFIFPQIDGLGYSETARFYAIQSRTEASAYLQHPVLGKRLRECAEAVLAIPERSALAIFGEPDDAKLRSCATLFATVSPPASVFERVLETFFNNAKDNLTLAILNTAER